MVDSNEIIEELKHIECATDSLLERVTDVLEHYNPNGEYQIIAEEDDDFINDHIRIYNAFSEDGISPSIAVVVKNGFDDYVAKVLDAYEIEE
jgi:fibronectin type 3 domain-containing protein